MGPDEGGGLRREEKGVCQEHRKMLTVLLERMKVLEVEKDGEISALARS